MSKTILEISQISKKFGEKTVVSNVTFAIREGEIFGLLGPNGAGKTTIMKMTCGLTNITDGEIHICDFSVAKSFEKAMSFVGAIIETPQMFSYLSGLDNLKYYMSLTSRINTKNIYKIAKIVGLENRLKDKIGKYSLGMKQRLGIGQALLSSPKLLILDEPFNGLDPSGVKEMRDLLKLLASKYNVAILISSHMLSDMEQICDTIGIMNKGQMLEIKSIKQYNDAVDSSKRIRIKVDYPNFAGKLLITNYEYKVDIAGNSLIVHTSENNINKITSILHNNGINLFGLEVITKSLEQIYLEVIEKYSQGKSGIV